MIKRMNKQRIIWADSLKGMLIILVVLGHAIQCVLLEDCEKNHLWNLIYYFYMPAFMAISGYFAYKANGGRAKLVQEGLCNCWCHICCGPLLHV